MQTHRLLFCSSVLVSCAAHAGRPLTVDDAEVNSKGAGHVEAFYARQPGHAHTLVIAPAWFPLEGLELGAAVTRDRTAASTSQALQTKWRITSGREKGCNTGSVIGLVHTGGAGHAPYLNGLLTCNSAWGASHFNLGGVRNPGSATAGTWGLAHERSFGAVTAHVEAFGQRHAKPTFQVGARTLVTRTLQLDGSLGRNAGDTLFSIGFVQSF